MCVVCSLVNLFCVMFGFVEVGVVFFDEFGYDFDGGNCVV